MPATLAAPRLSRLLPRRGAAPRRHARGRLLLASGGLAVLGLLVLAPGAFAFFTPPSGASPNARAIHSLYVITLVIALLVFVGVEGALLFAVVKYRARRGAVAAQIRGNTVLEASWTIGAAVILVVLAVVTFAKLSEIQNPANSLPNGDKLVGQSGLLANASLKLPPNGKALRVIVNGRQYVWQYVYPGADQPDGLGAPYAYEAMVVPTNTTVVIDVRSEDVVHSWWIPDLGGKLQAIPGYHNYGWFRIDKPGIYKGQCAEICGEGHARMIAQVDAVTPAQFDAWLSYQKQALASANLQAAAARKLLDKQNGPGSVSSP